VQARNNARVMVAGSLFMLSDEAFDSSVTLAASGKTCALRSAGLGVLLHEHLGQSWMEAQRRARTRPTRTPLPLC
jgi:hypothetical protein